jgi:hypothetical protein
VAIDRNQFIPVSIYRQGSDPTDIDADELDVDLDLELYVAQGRVKVAS